MQFMQGLVSVVVPVYNRERYIEECIRSILAQTYENFEVILVDDGSDDHSYDMCQKLSKEDSRVKVYQTDHVGVSAARNIALEKLQGEYVLFLDSDDVIYPLLLETFVKAMENTDAEIAGSCVRSVSESSWHRVIEKISETPVPSKVSYKTNPQAVEALFDGKSGLNCIGGVMMKRSLIGQTRFRQDLFIGEDYYFIYENLIKGAAYVEVADKWYYARLHQSNSSWHYDYEGFWTRFYRRELVWKSEEALGRKQYADIEKKEAFGCFLLCFKKNDPHSVESKKMRDTVWAYRKELLPALSQKSKILLKLSRFSPSLLKALLKNKG